MADQQLKQESEQQPIGWTQRRAEVREINGEQWREIAVDFSETARQARHLEILAELKADLLTTGELYDYLRWVGDHYDIDISDMYRMYLGYGGTDGEG